MPFPPRRFSLKGASMLLAIDAGNTNVVFALVDDGKIRARWRIATDPRRTADEYVVWLNQLLELESLSRTDVTSATFARFSTLRAPRRSSASALMPRLRP